jgi:L-alanine-DL-glutamate epimerase-like enolase superfamily enzyme
VDIALWDIKGKHLQAPIWELLGGRRRDRIRLHLLMEGETADEIAVAAGAAAAEGFTALKLDPLPPRYQDMGLAPGSEQLTELPDRMQPFAVADGHRETARDLGLETTLSPPSRPRSPRTPPGSAGSRTRT